MKIRKKVTVAGIFLGIGLAFVCSRVTVGATSLEDSIKEKQAAISKAQEEKDALKKGLSDVKSMVATLEKSKNDLTTYVKELDSNLADIQAKIEELKGLISEKKEEIEVTSKELEAAQQVADKQYEDMKTRLRYLYENSNSNRYLDIMLGADSFSDMMNSAMYIEKMSAYDNQKLEEYKQNVEYVRLCKEALEEEKTVLEEAEAGVEKEQSALETLISEKEKEITAYQSDINTKEDAIADYEADIAAQDAVIAALEKAVAEEKAKLAQEQGRRTYDGGMFQMPCPSYTRISSEYGNRLHPTLNVYKFHNGVDFAAPTGSPILAAYDGEVVGAGYNASMGNYIMIDHGDSLYTIYMHASALYVSTGATVAKGQKIAAVGSTGRSTGPHLHFGVRLNGSYVSPWGYLQ